MNFNQSILLSFTVKHTERTKECDVCHMKFHTNDKLKTHKRTHTGEKPYVCKCKNCPAAYAQSYDLVKHMKRSHVGMSIYSCNKCSMSFQNYADLRKHICSRTTSSPTNFHTSDDVEMPSTSKSDLEL